MDDVTKENYGFLFKNREKKREEHSDYDGRINIEGRQFYINGWINEKNGRKYMAVRVRAREDRQQAKPALKVVAGNSFTDADEVPF